MGLGSGSLYSSLDVPHHCKGCFNQETWDFTYGEQFTQKIMDQIMEFLENRNCAGLSLLGGEPMYPATARELEPFLLACKAKFPEKKIWAWSGYLFEELFLTQNPILPLVDVLVDGPFIEAEKDLTLKFRGSKNQRIIDVPKSILQTKAILLEEN